MKTVASPMHKPSARFYDLRFGILIAIIAIILMFKYFYGQSPNGAPGTSNSPTRSNAAQSSPVNAPRP